MSLLSVHIPHVEGSASGHVSPEDLEKAETSNEFSGRMPPMNKEGDVQKSLLPISDNAALLVWMPRDLSIYSNSERVYAICPTAVALLRGQGCREISQSAPLSMIFAILTHCLKTTAINNYFIRTQGQRFC